MLSNKVLHKTVQDIKNIAGFDCAVWDRKGTCLVMTHEKMQKCEKQVQELWQDADENLEILREKQGFRYLLIRKSMWSFRKKPGLSKEAAGRRLWRRKCRNGI